MASSSSSSSSNCHIPHYGFSSSSSSIISSSSSSSSSSGSSSSSSSSSSSMSSSSSSSSSSNSSSSSSSSSSSYMFGSPRKERGIDPKQLMDGDVGGKGQTVVIGVGDANGCHPSYSPVPTTPPIAPYATFVWAAENTDAMVGIFQSLPSQSAPILQVQTSAGTPSLEIDADGNMNFYPTAPVGPKVLWNDDITGQLLISAIDPIPVSGTPFGTPPHWWLRSTGSVVSWSAITLADLGIPTMTPGTYYVTTITVESNGLIGGISSNLGSGYDVLTMNGSGSTLWQLIHPCNLDTSVAGSGLTGGNCSPLSVVTDNASININGSNQLQVDNAITANSTPSLVSYNQFGLINGFAPAPAIPPSPSQYIIGGVAGPQTGISGPVDLNGTGISILLPGTYIFEGIIGLPSESSDPNGYINIGASLGATITGLQVLEDMRNDGGITRSNGQYISGVNANFVAFGVNIGTTRAGFFRADGFVQCSSNFTLNWNVACVQTPSKTLDTSGAYLCAWKVA